MRSIVPVVGALPTFRFLRIDGSGGALQSNPLLRRMRQAHRARLQPGDWCACFITVMLMLPLRPPLLLLLDTVQLHKSDARVVRLSSQNAAMDKEAWRSLSQDTLLHK